MRNWEMIESQKKQEIKWGNILNIILDPLSIPIPLVMLKLKHDGFRLY